MAIFASFKPYTKLPLSASDVVTKLQAQGLSVGDTNDAAAFLGWVNYFRFRGYLYRYLDLVNIPAAPLPKNFKAGASFDRAVEMYRFDEGLRKLIFGLLPDLEVALRTVLDATMCSVAGHGFWYLQPEWFSNNRHPAGIINSLSASFCDSSEKYANHFQATYYNLESGVYKHLPPF